MVPEWDLNGSPFKALAATFCITCVIMEAHLDTEPAVRESRKPARGLPCSPFLGFSTLPSHAAQYCSDCVLQLSAWNAKQEVGTTRDPQLPAFALFICLFFFLGVESSSTALAFCGNCPARPSLFLKKNGPFPEGEGDRC